MLFSALLNKNKEVVSENNGVESTMLDCFTAALGVTLVQTPHTKGCLTSIFAMIFVPSKISYTSYEAFDGYMVAGHRLYAFQV